MSVRLVQSFNPEPTVTASLTASHLGIRIMGLTMGLLSAGHELLCVCRPGSMAAFGDRITWDSSRPNDVSGFPGAADAVNAGFDATVSVYTGTRDDLEQVACADDPPSLAFDARSGTTYHIMVASCCDSEGGRATVTMTRIVPPTLAARVRGGTADTRTGDATVKGVVTCDNAKAALLTRGLVEITRLGMTLGARPQTFSGLAGIGDLITTCVSPLGRNRQKACCVHRGHRRRQSRPSPRHKRAHRKRTAACRARQFP